MSSPITCNERDVVKVTQGGRRSHSTSVSLSLQDIAELENDLSPQMKKGADILHRWHEPAEQHTTISPPPSPGHQLRLDGDYAQPSNHLHAPVSRERKNSRRTYFDYGLATSSHAGSRSPSPNSVEFEATQLPLFRSHSRSPSPTPYSPSWELPPPSHARTSMHDHTAPYDKDFRTESFSFYHSQPFWLVLYFFFNLSLTLYNKGVLIRFPFAYTLTALHALCGSIGGFVLLKLGVYVPAKLTDADNLALVAFSILYTINIAVSNLSLQLVTIPVSPSNGCFISNSSY
ncbi:hypothetical protein PAXINDRAFT_20858 [Paxillus involutus ATCC 200175]|uniref:Unplaced genomic scaffold PAXINscaffold_1309, whole genome shotgun sequence n=1 Tax=Paxillus involutus ATCC 200175 TaxID=664439 RepID=A0A0C9SMC1_PAXIN|nr:hypothetical protein PAXINDRAFT_20858 [Paxillus involutus ATCC 200175]